MPRSPKSHLLAAAVAGLTLAVPAAAQAADGFVAVTHGDQLVTLHSDTIPGLSEAASIAGLPTGERLVALDAQPSGELLALGAGGTLYGLDAPQHRVTRTIAALGAVVPAGSPVTLSVAADGRTARVIATGRDKTVDLATGQVTADAAAPAGVAADLGADGVLRGVDPASNSVVTLDGAGEHVVAPLKLQTHSPTAVTTAADGATWILTALAPRPHGQSQSRMLRYDPRTGQLLQQSSFLFQQLDAIAATGTVADDTTAPSVTVRIPRQDVRSALKDRGFVAIVSTSEPGQTVVSARLGSGYRGFGFATAIHRGQVRVVAGSRQSQIRGLGGKRIRLHLAVHDWAGNTKLIDRFFTLGR
ncbi:MAG: hypothetical protein JWR63_1941 [Conexibacter sp.]|nr:hypothetical protein [Conexibacter sp.]